MDMKQAIQRVADRQDLTGEEAGEVMELLLTGAATQAQIGAFLTGLRMKGETIDEIAGLASVLADKAEHIHPHSDHYIDLVGTGGDCTYSFNISTTSAIVTAAAGVSVAKHGNRSISSKSGAGDVLEQLGVNIMMEPEKVVPYFGTIEKPECHMLYNVTMMATTWNTVATRDTRLLRMQLDIMNNLPKEYTFLNYLRCHDDIGWGLDFQTLSGWGMQEVPHKRYLNDFFTGKIAESVSRGELYNEDPITGDARFCATTASMCGIESAGFEQNEEKKKRAVRFDLMLHAYMMVQSGIPMLYSGDEIGQVNDYTYKNDPEKRVDSRYIHRGKFDWKLADGRKRKGTVQKELFDGIGKLRSIRSKEKVFDASANVWTLDTWENGILGVVRELEGEQMTALFNFAEEDRTAWIEEEGEYMDLYTGKKVSLQAIKMEGHSFVLAKKC